MNLRSLNNTANSLGPSVDTGSLVTNPSLGPSGGPRLQRTMSIVNEPYARGLPASPMPLSNDILSTSTVMRRASSTSAIVHETMTQEPGANLMHAQKKPRLDPRANDGQEQQVLHLPQIQESLHLQQRLAQQTRQQQRQIMQFLPDTMRASVPQELRPSTSDTGPCARRLHDYLNHQRQRPPDNSILYWRWFVANYFAPRAKQRCCLSQYDNAGSRAFGAFPRAAMAAWTCDICGSRSGKGFEAACEVLPRLNQIKFDCGIVDELFHLNLTRECRLSSGIRLLDCAKVIQISIYERLRVVREGHLRIKFTPDLKILSWEFCARHHEVFFSRRAAAPQVNKLLQVAYKYQTAVNESGSAGPSVQDFQASCNMFMTATNQLAKILELQSLNEFGFPKRYMRCLQTSEVVNSMKDLMDFTLDNMIGPIDSLKIYPRALNTCDPEQTPPVQNPPAAPHASNTATAMATNPVIGSDTINGQIANDALPASPVPNNYQYVQETSTNCQNPNPLQPPQPGQIPWTSQHVIQGVIQGLLQEMNRRGTNSNVASEEADVGSGPSGSGALSALLSGGPVSGTMGSVPSGSNGVRTAANNSSSCDSDYRTDMLCDLHLPSLDQDFLCDYMEGGEQ